MDSTVSTKAFASGRAVQASTGTEEWLGPEAHVPALNKQLRRRSSRGDGFLLGLLLAGTFLAGVAIGSGAVLLARRDGSGR